MRLADNRAIGSIIRFARVYIAVFRDGLTGQSRRVMLVWIFEAVAALSQGLVIATIANGVHFVEAMGTGQSEAMSGFKRTLFLALPAWLRTETGLLLGVIGVSTFLLIAAETSRYLPAVIARKMARNYHQRLIRRLFDYLADERSIRFRGNGGTVTLRIAALQYTMHTARAFQQLIQTPQTAVFFVFFFLATFLLMWQVSAALTMMSLIFLPVAFYASRSIHASAGTFFGDSARIFNGLVATTLMRLNSFYFEGDRAAKGSAAILETPMARSYFDGIDGVQLASARMGYITGMVKAVIFGTMLVSIGTLVILKKADPSLIVGYAIALYVALSYLQTLFGHLANLNIFYPQVAKSLAMWEAWDRSAGAYGVSAARRPAVAATEEFAAVADRKQQVPGALPRVSVGAGAVIDLVSLDSIGRFNPDCWLQPLATARGRAFAPDEFCLFNALPVNLAPMTLGDLDLALTQRFGFSVLDLVGELRLKAEFDLWFGADNRSLDETSLDYELFQRMSGRVRHAVYLCTAVASGAPVVFLDGRLLYDFTPEQHGLIRARLRDRLLLVWRQPSQRQPLECDYRMLLKDGQIKAILPATVDDKVLLDVYAKAGARPVDELESIALLESGEFA